MTYYLIIALCIIIIVSYVFEITGSLTKIPGVILLIITGMAGNYLLKYLDINIPDISGLLPMMGTLGLILIVLEGSLDLKISKEKSNLILGSVSSAILLFVIFELIFSYLLIYFHNVPLKVAIINTIPLGIISSAVAIPSASGLNYKDREFVTYESSFSDIIGILAFDLILSNYTSIGMGIMGFTFELLGTIILSVIFSAGLAYILHKINHHIKYVIITTVIILIYTMAKLAHAPSLLVVLIFGLVMNNNQIFNNRYTKKKIDFESFSVDLKAFKNITGEFTFVIRSFFFIMFGYYTNPKDLLDLDNLIISLMISVSIYIIRALYFKIVLKSPLNPLLYFAPRGLITILLFLTIPVNMSLPYVNKGMVTQVIFITILMMAFGNMFLSKAVEKIEKL